MRLIRKPVLCNYYLTYRCNAKCDFCDIWERPSPYVSEENFKKNLHDLKKLGVKVIDFTGGEPLLHQELPRFLDIAKKQGFITTVTTNCLLYPKNAPRLAGLIDMLHFSLDSADEQEHNEMRGVDCFGFVLESIRIAQSLGEQPDILFTVFDHNFDQIERVYKEISQPNDLVLILNPAFDYNNLGVTEYYSPEQNDKLRWWGKQKGVYINEAFLQLRADGGNHTSNPICKAGSSTIVISPDNKLVTPCYHLGEKEFPIEDDLYNLYKSPEIREEINKEGTLPACEGCTINCYMQPSFSVEMNKYWWKALPSTLKYNRMKGTWKQLL